MAGTLHTQLMMSACSIAESTVVVCSSKLACCHRAAPGGCQLACQGAQPPGRRQVTCTQSDQCAQQDVHAVVGEQACCLA